MNKEQKKKRDEVRVKLRENFQKWLWSLAVIDEKFKMWLLAQYDTCQARLYNDNSQVAEPRQWADMTSEYLYKEYREVEEQLDYLSIFTDKFKTKVFQAFNNLWYTYNPNVKIEEWNI